MKMSGSKTSGRARVVIVVGFGAVCGAALGCSSAGRGVEAPREAEQAEVPREAEQAEASRLVASPEAAPSQPNENGGDFLTRPAVDVAAPAAAERETGPVAADGDVERALAETVVEVASGRTPLPAVGGGLRGTPGEADGRLESLLANLAANAANPKAASPPVPALPAGMPAAAPASPSPADATALKPEPPPAAPPAGQAGAEKPADPQAAPRPARPQGHVVLKTMFHKTSDDFIKFLRDYWPEWVEKGHVSTVAGRTRSVVVTGEKPEPTDPLALRICQIVDEFDDLDLRLDHRIIRPRYVDLDIVMDSLVMRGLAHIWQITEETDTLTWKQGDATRQASRKRTGYIETGLVQGATAPITVSPKVPFVYEVPKQDPFVIPRNYAGSNLNEQLLVSFDKSSSTEERGGMVAVGTEEDIEAIQAFVDTIDVPARRIMIEVQVIELEASKLSDLGLDSVQFGGGHSIGTLALPLPGEPILQPGLGSGARGNPADFVPPVVSEGFAFLFDDTSFDLQGRFLSRIHALVREGEAKIKARPKILTLDDRASVLHLGREVPTFKSTKVTRDSVEGNLISEVNEVTSQYVGLTLNMRPRVTGGAEDEISLQIEILINELVGRSRVFEEDLLGIPETVRRHYIGQTRVRNHRPIILGGLIQEQEEETVNKIPLLGEIPYLGYLFRRTQKIEVRREIILVVTPHVLSDKGVDRAATPKESLHFDTFDSVLFNDRHILKGGDVLGLDPVNSTPAQGADGAVFTKEDVVDLTLLNVIRSRELVSKLNLLENYLGDDLDKLNWIQRHWPESTIGDWVEGDKELYFRVAAICLENIKELNPDLTFEEIVLPRRELLLPSSPYQISLTFDRVKRIQRLGIAVVLRGERVELEEKHIDLVREAGGRSLRSFADFLGKRGRTAQEHGDLPRELERLRESGASGGAPPAAGDYPGLFRALEDARVDFLSLATFLTTNLSERYEVSGRPDVGLFPSDVKDFLSTSVSLMRRAKDLQRLEERWAEVNSASSAEEP